MHDYERNALGAVQRPRMASCIAAVNNKTIVCVTMATVTVAIII